MVLLWYCYGTAMVLLAKYQGRCLDTAGCLAAANRGIIALFCCLQAERAAPKSSISKVAFPSAPLWPWCSAPLHSLESGLARGTWEAHPSSTQRVHLEYPKGTLAAP